MTTTPGTAHETGRTAVHGPSDPVGAAVDWRSVAFQSAVVGGLLAALYWHVLRLLVWNWMNVGDWSHGFLIPVFSLYYLYMQRHRFPSGMYGTGLGGLALLLGAFAVYTHFTCFASFTYPRSLSLIAAILGSVWLLCGWPIARWAWFPIVFLLFAVPVPPDLYDRMTLPLQRIASGAATVLLNLLPDMEADAQNIVISYLYKGRTGMLNVEQACSGIRLMMAFMALGVAMAFASERPLWHRMVMVLSCVPIAILCNVVRVTTTGLFHVFGREDLARGTAHSMLGLSMLLIAFGLYGLISYVLGRVIPYIMEHLFVDVPEEPAA